ncbi:MAG: hypothetical protein GY753_03365 [Gammaproteobacteria bacterium]|nr:hypothetical protein [Gammaproteobacteria bacterium]
MKRVSTGRAIVIALLFIATPVFSGNKIPADQPVINQTDMNKTSPDVVAKMPATHGVETGVADVTSGLDADNNKDKLTIFFAIGLVINIVLMSLFGMWAVRQWRKSDKEG